jgi:hypothetical protein
LSIGLKRAENLYQIKKGRNSISKDLAELIAGKYSNISKSWLLTGEGAMFTDDSGDEAGLPATEGKIPFYGSVLTQMQGMDLRHCKTVYYMVIPVFADCDLAVSWMGDSMGPDIPSGSIVALREVDIQSVFSGEIYLLVTDHYTTIRRIRATETDDLLLRLIPANKTEYDETIVKKEMIRRLFLVKGVISVKTV